MCHFLLVTYTALLLSQNVHVFGEFSHPPQTNFCHATKLETHTRLSRSTDKYEYQLLDRYRS